jgi:RNA 2',3'-cyclic 3'-phosphodiesterase
MGIRSFVAVNIDEGMKKDLYTTTQRLREIRCDVKWVSAENMHITLKFLGDTPEGLLPEISGRLSGIASSHLPFTIRLRSAGVFPDRRRPRVVWIDMSGTEEIIKLQKEVEESLATLGYKKENRAFSPHLTIGRVRAPQGSDLLVKGVETLKEKDFGIIQVEKISLMRSDLSPAGARYMSVGEFFLGKEKG